MSAPISANARSSIEIDNSCNNCCPRLLCGRKVKKHKTDIRKASDHVPIPKDAPLPVIEHTNKAVNDLRLPLPPARPPSVKYGIMPTIADKKD
jgi:hypothetical protein